jgi:hypothetical protein
MTYGFLALCGAAAALLAVPAQPPANLGYSDTPMLPGGKWHVHDGNRPQPPIVTPPPPHFTPAPPDAIRLDGAQWTNAKWVRKNGELVSAGGNNTTRDAFGDCQLHVEFRTPSPPKGSGQGRGNSGVFLMGQFEIQVLDSYENKTYPDGQAGAVYGQTPPLVNASLKPGAWQTYDIYFKAPRFDASGTLQTPAYVTVLHNGILIQNNTEILGTTNHRTAPVYTPLPAKAPLSLQDHGDEMHFRNLWIRPIGPSR